MQQFQKEKESKKQVKSFAKTVKKRTKKKENSKAKTSQRNLEPQKTEDLNFYFGEELRNDQVVLKPVEGWVIMKWPIDFQAVETSQEKFENSGFDQIIAKIKRKKQDPGREREDIDLGTEFQMIQIGGLKEEIGQILQQDLNNLTDLHMEVQGVFQKYLRGIPMSDGLGDLQFLMSKLGMMEG